MMELPVGFRFAGITCGIKKSGRPDLALVVADPGSIAAGIYTKNLVVAAPVVLCRSRTPGVVRAIVVNSGNANACTGDRGEADARQMTTWVAETVGCEPEQVLVMSTGIIGHHLPMEKIEAGIGLAASKLDITGEAFLAASDAILTTDNGRKVLSESATDANGKPYHLSGMCKGAGMIGPNMATMLGLVVTDFPLSISQADRALRFAANRSFNCISVEGHTSTNDSLVLMSSRATPQGVSDSEFDAFRDTLTRMCIRLAKQIPADGEGATHVIEICVRGAATDDSAHTIAKTIADSSLVKTAITGGDPNWGRIVSAAGYSGEPLVPSEMSLTIQGIEVYQNGAPIAFDAKVASSAIRDSHEVKLGLSVGNGQGQATFWTSDLTVDYVRFNSEYTT